MKQFISILITTLVISCSPQQTIEVGLNELAVITNNNLEMTILYTGQHSIPESFSHALYDTSSQKYEFSLTGITNDSVYIELVGRMYFKPNIDSIKIIDRDYGETYKETIVIPDSRALFRDVISNISQAELIESLEDSLPKAIFDYAHPKLYNRHIVISTVEIDSVWQSNLN